MITSAHDDDYPISNEDRARWLGLLPETSVCGVGGRGTCPSIDLAYQSHPVECGFRAVLRAETATGNTLVMLFIADDLLSYLEVVPMDDESMFLPDPSDLSLFKPQYRFPYSVPLPPPPLGHFVISLQRKSWHDRLEF